MKTWLTLSLLAVFAAGAANAGILRNYDNTNPPVRALDAGHMSAVLFQDAFAVPDTQDVVGTFVTEVNAGDPTNLTVNITNGSNVIVCSNFASPRGASSSTGQSQVTSIVTLPVTCPALPAGKYLATVTVGLSSKTSVGSARFMSGNILGLH